MGPSDEQLWSTYAAAAIMGGHRFADAIDQIATEAVALHRRRFPVDAPAPVPTPSAAHATNQPPPLPAGAPDTLERPGKGKESSR